MGLEKEIISRTKSNEAVEKQLNEEKQLKEEADDAVESKLTSYTETADGLEESSDLIRKEIAKDIDDCRVTEQNQELDSNDTNGICNQIPDHLHTDNDAIKCESDINKIVEIEENKGREITKRISQYNIDKVAFEQEKSNLERQKENETGNMNATSEIDSESGNEMKNSLGFSKVIQNSYRGITQKEKSRKIQEAQLQQIQEKAQRKKAEKETENYWAKVEDLKIRAEKSRKESDDLKKREMYKKNQEENIRLAAQQAAQRKLMK